MKKPLIGSVSSADTISRESLVAMPLSAARRRSHSPIPPDAAYRLAMTTSSASALSIASIRGSSISSCCISASMTAR